MTRNIIHLKEHQFKHGPDPRRNIKGAPSGANPLIALKRRATEKHAEDIMDIIALLMEQAKDGHFKSQKLVVTTFVLSAITDITVNNCDDTPSIERVTNVPKDVLEAMRDNYLETIGKYSNDDNKGDGE